MESSTQNAATPTRRPRRWYQFSLRTAFLAITLIAVLLGWFVVPLVRRHAAIERLERMEVSVLFANTPPDEGWITRTLRDYLPKDYFDDVQYVNYLDKVDPNLTGIGTLSHLQELVVDSSSPITDAGMAQLQNLTQLKTLSLNRTKLAPASFHYLAGLTQLEVLYLYEATVTDESLAPLGGLTNLQSLHLGKISISDAGLVHLANLTQLENLGITETAITDAGLAHLAKMAQLRDVNLSHTKITDAGLLNLKGLRNLIHLNFTSPPISSEGVAALRRHLPKCSINLLITEPKRND